MAALKKFFSRYGLLVMLVVDVVTLGILFDRIPRIPRPFEVMMGVTAGLMILTAIFVRKEWVRSAMLIVASVAVTVFAFEMGEKYFSLTNIFVPSTPQPDIVGGGGKYAWNRFSAASYLEALDRAVADGVVKDEDRATFAGDIFAGRDKSEIGGEIRDKSPDEDGYFSLRTGMTPVVDSPLGYENGRNGLDRQFYRNVPSGRYLFDAAYSFNHFGGRKTRGNPDAEEVYIFLGCSFTFGFGLNEDQTLPYFFSREMGFRANVINVAVSGYGPNHALRELELNYRLGLAGINPSHVRGVYFGFIDDHANRVVLPKTQNSVPYYKLDGDKLVYLEKGGYFSRRFFIMMGKSRIYPVLLDRFLRSGEKDTQSYRWRLTWATLREMDRIVRERYHVPLTVVYWDDDPNVTEELRNSGLQVLFARDALGAKWRDQAIRYLLHDTHPGPAFNRELAKYIFEKTVDQPAGKR